MVKSAYTDSGKTENKQEEQHGTVRRHKTPCGRIKAVEGERDMIQGNKQKNGEGKKEGLKPEPGVCSSCGGQLERKNPYLYQCASCKRTYYISADRSHRVTVQVSAGRLVVACAVAAIIVAAIAMTGYQFYTGHLVASASRFSVVFRDFLMEAYQKPVAEISPEDLAGMKYLKIEKGKKYRFTYSYEDYYDFTDGGRFEDTLHTIEISGRTDDFSPSNVQYFTGLTRLELYTGGWENYTLPKENVLQGIYCVDGMSKYGTPQFFSDVNPDTLKEVGILKAEGRRDFSFMESLRGVKRFVMSDAKLEDSAIFDGFEELEELYLYYVVMEEEDAAAIVEELLSLPSLKHFYIEGKTAWYITEEQWEKWEKMYGDRIFLERK